MTGNAASWFVDRHIEAGRSEKVAFREAFNDGRELTYGALAEQSGQVGHALLRAGIHREERAAMCVLDQIEFPLLFWGAIKAGVAPVPLNTLLATDVYAAMLNDSRASIAFVSVELLDTVLPAIQRSPHIRQTVVIGGRAPEGTVSWSDFIKDAEPITPVECSPDEVAFWLYSSGSTGAPKGVRHVHESLQVTCTTFADQVLGIKETDVVFSAAKLFFAYGLGNGMSFPLSAGATSLLLNSRPTPESVSDVFTQHKPTVFYGVPTLFAAMIHYWDANDNRPEFPLRLATSAGEALPAEIGRKWQALWGIDIIDGVGSTEMLHIFLSNRPGDVQYGTSGTAVPGYDVKLVDEHGVPVRVGEIGELLVCGKSAASDYWNQRDKTRRTFEGEWTRTGDKYELTDNGRYIYCGRTDDMFKVSGIWVSPFEIEQALIEHPAVLEAAVVAQRDEDNLEKPKAFVVFKDDHDSDNLEDIKHFIKEKIGKWKYPRWIESVDDLPKTATGKIQRFKLRQLA